MHTAQPESTYQGGAHTHFRAPFEETHLSTPGENIICFSKDWSEDPTSNNHVMRELARENRVVWINSLSTRTPKLTSKRDLGKIFSKLRGFFKGPVRVEERLWVYTPLVLPFPHSRLAVRLNRAIVRATVWALRKRLGMREFQLWTFLPNTEPYVGTLGEKVSIYYCVDEWSGFSYVDGPRIAEAEAALCRKVDLVFATCGRLCERKRVHNPNTFLAPHGVDHALFSAALDPATKVPGEIANLPHPVIGFYGTIQDWVDLDLIEQIARRRPEWSFVLVGNVLVDTSRFNSLPNVHLPGRFPHADLPRFCKGFDVGLIPYIISDRVLDVNPLKLREYLCAGLPVVSTPVPEVARYSQFCKIADSVDEFEQAIDEALRTDSPALRRARSDAMRTETWESRVSEVMAQVMRAKERRWQSTRLAQPGIAPD